VKEIITVRKNLFNEGTKGLSNSQIAMQQVISKIANLGKKLLDDMNSIKGSLSELEKIALKPRVLTDE
jgi:hypothetical protein